MDKELALEEVLGMLEDIMSNLHELRLDRLHFLASDLSDEVYCELEEYREYE